MGNIFAELQQLTLETSFNTISDTRKELNDLVDFMKGRDDYLSLVTIFAEKVRNLDVDTLVKADSFMCQDMMSIDLPERLRHVSLGFCRGAELAFDGRYVYPVKDVHGDVMGFCGYDKYSDTKYLDSLNYGYKAKTYSLYGMEELPTYYRNNLPVFFVEGIVCALYLRQCGLQSLAFLGSSPSRYVIEIIKRLGSRAVVMIDADEAGSNCRRYLNRILPSLRVMQSAVAKDIDDSREVISDFAEELTKMQNPFYRSNYFY